MYYIIYYTPTSKYPRGGANPNLNGRHKFYSHSFLLGFEVDWCCNALLIHHRNLDAADAGEPDGHNLQPGDLPDPHGHCPQRHKEHSNL